MQHIVNEAAVLFFSFSLLETLRNCRLHCNHCSLSESKRLLLPDVCSLFWPQVFRCVCVFCADADLQDGHVLRANGQPPAQRCQTDAVC